MRNISKKDWLYVAIGAASVALIIVIILAFSGKYNNENNNDNNSEPTASQAVQSQETKSDSDTAKETDKTAVSETIDGPTFMYIVSDKDSNYNEYMKTVDELKSEYKDRVNFSISDINENEYMKDLIGEGASTPCLIMMNKDGASVAIEFACTDKEKMKADIELALK